jgi:cysteine-rich repeat protein
VNVLQCLSGCGTDNQCQQGCLTQFPAGTQILQQLSNCVGQFCSFECGGGSGGSAGGGTGGAGGGAGGTFCGNGVIEPGEQCDQGNGNFDSAALTLYYQGGLGTAILPLSNFESAVSFYGYSSASSHTGYEAASASRALLFTDATTGQLSLVLLHGIDSSTGQIQPPGSIQMQLNGLPPSSFVALSDDPGELMQTGVGLAQGKWKFSKNTDGGVISGLPLPGDWSLTVSAQFLSGIQSWTWVDASGNAFDLGLGGQITIVSSTSKSSCRTNCTIPTCGDGILDAGEACDDGNTFGGDLCPADCHSFGPLPL